MQKHVMGTCLTRHEQMALRLVERCREPISHVAEALLASDVLLLTRKQVSAIARPLMKKQVAATVSRPR